MPFSMKSASIITTCLILLPLGSVARGEVAPKVIEDSYAAILINGQKAGYSHTKMVMDGEEVTTEVEMRLKMTRAATPLSLSLWSWFQESSKGEPRRFKYELRLARTPVRSEGYVEGGKMHLKTTMGKYATDTSVDFDPEAMFPYGLREAAKRQGLKPGTEYMLKVFEPALSPQFPQVMKVKVGEVEKIDLFGRVVNAHQIENTLVGLNDTVEKLWCDQDARPLRSVTSLIGIEMEVVQCAKAFALQPRSAPELMAQSLVALNTPLPGDGRFEKAIFRLRQRQAGSKALTLPSNERQTVEAEDVDDSWLLTIYRARRQVDPELESDPELAARYLAANGYVNSEDPEIIKLLDQRPQWGQTPLAIALELEEFVHEYMTERSLNVGMGSASEAVRTREGDCSEHAVLLAAMARAKGIPARCAMGLLYLPEFMDRQYVFGGHMWTQIYLGGHWIDLDATRPLQSADPIYICQATSDMKWERLTSDMLELFSSFNNLQIELVETVPLMEQQPGR